MAGKRYTLAAIVALLAAGMLVPYSSAQDDGDREREERMARRDRERDERMARRERAERERMEHRRRIREEEDRGHPEEPMERHLDLIEVLSDMCFEPENAAIIAIGGIKDEVRRRPREIIADLEGLLKKTKTLGLRNAIRFTLKDLYKHQAEDKKVLEHMRQMLLENDAAIQAEIARDREEEDDDDDDDDD